MTDYLDVYELDEDEELCSLCGVSMDKHPCCKHRMIAALSIASARVYKQP